MRPSQFLIVGLSALSGALVDFHSYRKAVNIAKHSGVSVPPFDWLCLAIDVCQGTSLGIIAATGLGRVV